MKDKPKIVVVGSANTDMILQVPFIPAPGETILGGSFATAAGGKGANQAVAAARAGGEVFFVARLGDDSLGVQARKGFIREGIQLEFLQITPGVPSGVALIFVDEQGQNSIGVSSGANAHLTVEDVEAAGKIIAEAKILILQLETPLESVQRAAEIAQANGTKVLLNPAPAQDIPDELWPYISILTPNESEAHILSGIPVQNAEGALKAGRVLLAKGALEVIITMGEKGAYWITPEQDHLFPPYPVQAVDTTAAGDTFNGALAVAIAEGRSLSEAIQFANIAAALSVTRFGAQPSVPIRKEIEKRLR